MKCMKEYHDCDSQVDRFKTDRKLNLRSMIISLDDADKI